ncbi:cyclic peptide export ABC transporter [Pseudanabaena sp. FACHB-2040]|uniref:cyclic peptide export ABC transporter n=1 Tax=Pseudanabaena sp. FACHB-2040 TaxID=2692859 RepID=UPI0016869CEA|nr:cyclic peptide export ABC transporter [Pseudanabaena sp. FACHB-2040]MBD2256025.1 cyclic peptide export ABC transporter [Pseudanabaena sp. FACHB-2040]
MQYIQLLLKRSWQTIVVAVLLGLISGLCNARLISLVNQAVSQPTQPQALMPFFVLVVMTLGIGVLSQFILISLSQDAIYQLRLTLSRNILLSPLPHLERLGDHRLLAALTDDVRVLSRTVTVFPNLCVDLATIGGCLAYLAWLSGPMFVLLVLISLVAVWSIQATIRKAQALFAIARDEEDHLFKHFQAITRGTKELKLNRRRRDDFLNHTLETSIRGLRQKNSHAMKIFALSDGLGQLSLFVTLGVVLFIAPHFISTPLPLLATYALTITYLTMPFQNLLHRLPDLLRGQVSLRKIDHMRLALAHEQEIDTANPRSTQPVCHLELKQVTYHYHPEGEEHGFTLGPINLSFQPGQITYLIGGNGSGKSTLAKLMTGLYMPQTGSISLCGTPINDQNREWYRQHISAIFSDFFLFDRCLGLDQVNLDQDVRRYLKQLHLDHKVQVRDGQLSTTRLSQGQRKRLALLTAYLEDRPIYIFDEWAADQEPAFRELFYTEILVKLKEQGKTVVVITHDDRYFYLADQLIKLDYGRVTNAQVPLALTR